MLPNPKTTSQLDPIRSSTPLDLRRGEFPLETGSGGAQRGPAPLRGTGEAAPRHLLAEGGRSADPRQQVPSRSVSFVRCGAIPALQLKNWRLTMDVASRIHGISYEFYIAEITSLTSLHEH